MSPAPRDPPHGFLDSLRLIGPGLVLTASVVGSGELIATTSLGARVGFLALWLIALSCIAKLPLQLLIGSWALQNRTLLLDALDELPGPRGRASWFIWLWFGTLILIAFQQGAMLGGVGQALAIAFPALPSLGWSAFAAAATAALLWRGSYGRIELLSSLMVAGFAFTTIACVGYLSGSAYAVTPEEFLSGWRFELPAGGGVLALAVFGITGVGTSELVLYAYWCQEKGYTRWAAPEAAGFERRLCGWSRVMMLDSLAALAIYTTLTLAFFVLGAAVLHPQGLFPEGAEMIVVLSRMYTQTFGPAAYYFFLVGAFFALYSTIFVSTAANARMFVDCWRLLGWIDASDDRRRKRWIRRVTTGLPLFAFLLMLGFQTPVWMVTVGGLAQSLMLPLVAFGALWLAHRDRVRASRPLRAAAWASAGVVAAFTVWGLTLE